MATQKQGRPLRLNAVVAERDGQPVTLRQAILRYLEDGIPYDTSVALVGVHRSTVSAWLNAAAHAQERITIDPGARLTPNDRDLIVFAQQVETAIASAEEKYQRLMNTMAEGGTRRTRVTVKTQTVDGQQVEVERTSTVETLPPSFVANRWILEERFGRRTPINVRINEGELSDAEAATHLGDAMERWLETHEADVPIETNGHANGSPPAR